MNTETLREICLKMVGCEEEIKWGADLVFSVGKKMFCVTSFEEPFKASFKVPDERFDELCNRDGLMPAPYLARAKWVQATNEAGFSKAEWESLVRQSYSLVVAKLSKKERALLDIHL